MSRVAHSDDACEGESRVSNLSRGVAWGQFASSRGKQGTPRISQTRVVICRGERLANVQLSIPSKLLSFLCSMSFQFFHYFDKNRTAKDVENDMPEKMKGEGLHRKKWDPAGGHILAQERG